MAFHTVDHINLNTTRTLFQYFNLYVCEYENELSSNISSMEGLWTGAVINDMVI